MDYEQIDKRVTISLGVNSFVANEDNYDSFIKGVDIALYKAKNNGKNQVVEYEK
jgi:diguanylate cyclase (GGDEF)-like protein